MNNAERSMNLQNKEKQAETYKYLENKRKILKSLFMGEKENEIGIGNMAEISEYFEKNRENVLSEALGEEWDYVLSFPNPDYENKRLHSLKSLINWNTISHEDAMEIFESCIKPENNSSISISHKMKKLERNIFSECFEKLHSSDVRKKNLSGGGKYAKKIEQIVGNEGNYVEVWQDQGTSYIIY